MDDGNDAGWTQYNPRTGEHDIIRADRFHRSDPNAEKKDDSTACMGIRVHIWNRAKVRRFITHLLIGGGANQRGYDALDLDFIKQGEAGGRLGQYKVLSCLPDKVAKYLLEFHASDYTGLGLPAIPTGSSSGTIHKMLDCAQVLLYFTVFHIFSKYTSSNFIYFYLIQTNYFQITALLQTILVAKSAARDGHLHLYSALVIGHTEKEGVQRVYSQPFAQEKRKAGQTRKHRQDLIFIRPPGTPIRGFRLTMADVWFCKVLLLFSFESRTDSGTKYHECAFVSVLWEYEGDERPGSNIL